VRVVRGRQVVEVGAAQLDSLLERYQGLTIDVGTGDGRFAYAHARRHPERLVIGLEPSRERLRETSWRALRKRSRGGLPNVMFVWSGVEQPPAELAGRATELHVALPWGRLLEGVVRPLPEVLAGLRYLAAPEGWLRLVLGADIWKDPVPVEVRGLPEVTPEYVEQVLRPAYAGQGLSITRVGLLSPTEIADLPSSWARRLAHGREQPRFLALEAVAA
jgi:16S rRNA (adenine(1408)-N(1))-methyltransferase